MQATPPCVITLTSRHIFGREMTCIVKISNVFFPHSVEIVSDAFEGMGLVQRHQLVYKILEEELSEQGGVHALALKTKTPAEQEANPRRD